MTYPNPYDERAERRADRAERRAQARYGTAEPYGGDAGRGDREPFGEPFRGDDPLRRQAVARLEARRGFWMSLAGFVVVNALMIAIWAQDGGFFWPIFILVGWTLALVGQAIRVFGAPSEDRVQAEMRRLRGER